MKKILCIAASMDTGGAETFLMKVFRCMDREKYHMDFCVSKPEKGFYDDEILAAGSKIFRIPLKTRNYFKFRKALISLLKTNHYDAVFRSGATGFMALELWIAKECGVKIRVFRSSNAGTTEGRMRQLINVATRTALTSVANVKIAPSMLAAEYTFGKETAKKRVVIMKNGLNVKSYAFDPARRDAIRKSLGIAERFVVGHIGRFSKQKNHSFVVKVFAGLAKENRQALLLLIGSGSLRQEIQDMVKSYSLSSRVLFLENRSDVPDLLMGMDAMILPSLFEGMPNVVIEAQTTGLPCIVSDTITKEANVTELVRYLPITEDESTIHKWVVALQEMYSPTDRRIYSSKMKEKGYEMTEIVHLFFDTIFESGESHERRS